MKDNEMCPWDIRPTNVEAMLIACNAQGKWEHENQRPAPYEWCIIPTRTFFAELCGRLLQLEAQVKND